jgi:hypothetical protein
MFSHGLDPLQSVATVRFPAIRFRRRCRILMWSGTVGRRRNHRASKQQPPQQMDWNRVAGTDGSGGAAISYRVGHVRLSAETRYPRPLARQRPTRRSDHRQYTHGVPDPNIVSTDGQNLDNFYLARPGAADVQLDLFGDYKSNRRPAIQARVSRRLFSTTRQPGVRYAAAGRRWADAGDEAVAKGVSSVWKAARFRPTFRIGTVVNQECLPSAPSSRLWGHLHVCCSWRGIKIRDSVRRRTHETQPPSVRLQRAFS